MNEAFQPAGNVLINFAAADDRYGLWYTCHTTTLAARGKRVKSSPSPGQRMWPESDFAFSEFVHFRGGTHAGGDCSGWTRDLQVTSRMIQLSAHLLWRAILPN
jgi:hypothetical protein